MTTGNAPPIEHSCSYYCDCPECVKAQRDELRDKLAAIESQPVPVEPEIPTVYYVTIPTGEYASVVTTASLSKWRAYINTMQSALQTCKHNSSVTMDELGEMRDALHRAQEERDAANDKALRVLRGQFTQICSYCGWEANREGAQWTDLQSHIKQCEHHPLVKAEATNQRMVELLKEPSEGMINAGYPPNDERAQSWDVTEVFKAVSAELLKEVEK